MPGSYIELMNRALPQKINRSGSVHTALIGDEDFVPDDPIQDSSSFNCGALCNEFEFARKVTQYYTSALRIDNAEGNELDELVTELIDLPRRSRGEEDEVYRNRYKFLVVAKGNYRRITKWAILDSLSYFIEDKSRMQVIEPFSSRGQYFQVRLEGVELTDGAIALDDPDTGYLDNEYVGGSGIGADISYVGALLDRIRAAGVDFDVMFINQYRNTITSDMIIGTVQVYITSFARIKSSNSIALLSDAEVT